MTTSGAKATDDQDRSAEAQGAERTLEEEIRQLREDVSQLSDHLRRISNRSVNAAQRAAKEGAEQLRGTAEDFQDELVGLVREKPLTSIAVAAAIGYLFALIAHR